MNQLTQLLRLCLHRSPRLTVQSNEGVMSATDEWSFVGFQLLYSSLIVRHKCPVCVIDLGMNADQRAWCRNQPGLMLVSPNLCALKFTGEQDWGKWNKPYFLTYSPFQKTLWLDPDTMVIDDLTQMFCLMRDGPVVFKTDEEIDPNDWFFARMPGGVGVPPNAFYPTTSVLGLDMHRDFYLVSEWMWVVENVVTNSKLEASAKRFDSAALAWGLAKHSANKWAMKNPAWNWPVLGGVNGRKFVEYPEVEDLLVGVKKDFPLAYILNWGWPQPWMTWPTSLLDIDPHRAAG